MCGSMRIGGFRVYHSEVIPVFGIENLAGQRILRVWRRSVRVESFNGGVWTPRRPVRCLVKASSYFENDCEFKVPEGMGIMGIIANDNHVNPNNRAFFVFTRPAEKKEMDEAVRRGFLPHLRHPLFGPLSLTVPEMAMA